MAGVIFQGMSAVHIHSSHLCGNFSLVAMYVQRKSVIKNWQMDCCITPGLINIRSGSW